MITAPISCVAACHQQGRHALYPEFSRVWHMAQSLQHRCMGHIMPIIGILPGHKEHPGSRLADQPVLCKRRSRTCLTTPHQSVATAADTALTMKYLPSKASGQAFCHLMHGRFCTASMSLISFSRGLRTQVCWIWSSCPSFSCAHRSSWRRSASCQLASAASTALHAVCTSGKACPPAALNRRSNTSNVCIQERTVSACDSWACFEELCLSML